MAILEVSHIEKHFGKTNVLKGCQLFHGGRHGTCHHRFLRIGKKTTLFAMSEFFWSVRTVEPLR